MLHAGFAGELSSVLAEDRLTGGRRALSAGDRARIEAREAAERSARMFEATLSAAGAAALLAVALVGVGAAVAVGVVIAVAIGARGRRGAGVDEPVRGPEDPDARWGVWRSVDPDPEYLRGRAA